MAKERASLTRASSTASSSASSCINVAGTNNACDSSVASHDSTPPTSQADEGADSDEQGKTLFDTIASVDGDEETEEFTRPASSRPRRSKGVATYNLAALSALQRSSSGKSAGDGMRSFSGDTLINREALSTTSSLRKNSGESNNRSNMDCETDEEGHSATASRERARSRRNSAHLLAKAADVVDRVKSTLGKRGRDAVDAGKEALGLKSKRQSTRLAALEQDKASSAEGQEERQKSSEPPSKKSRGASNLQRMDLVSFGKAKKEKKHFLKAGLYVGQTDASLAESNKKSTKRSSLRPRPSLSAALERGPLLPLPMFQHSLDKVKDKSFVLPYDVFTQLPKTEKPKWANRNQNTFVGDAKSEWRTTKLEASICTCKPPSEGSGGLGCGENCINRIMEYECDDNNCRLGTDMCSNRAFAELAARKKQLKRNMVDEDNKRKTNPYNYGIEVFKTKDRGYGVRSLRTFEPGQIIVEYSGEIINQETCDERMNNEYKGKDDYYLMTFEQCLIIDATTKGSVARFVNHSCEPNCSMEKRTVSGVPRMALFAGPNGIMTGEELTYDYNFDPFSDDNVQICRCGAENCRGFLGPRTAEAEKRAMLKQKEKEKEEEKEKESLAATLKRKFFGGSADASEPERKVLKKRKVPSLPRGWAYVDPKVEAQRLVEEAVEKGKRVESVISSTLEETVSNDREGKRVSRVARQVSSSKVTTVEKGGRSMVQKTETRVEMETERVSNVPKENAEKKSMLSRAASGLGRTASVLSRKSEKETGKVKERKTTILKQSTLNFGPTTSGKDASEEDGAPLLDRKKQKDGKSKRTSSLKSALGSLSAKAKRGSRLMAVDDDE